MGQAQMDRAWTARATSSTGTADNSVGSLYRMELRRPLRLLRRQQEPARERVPNNNGQRPISQAQLAARALPLPPFFLAASAATDLIHELTKHRGALDVALGVP